MLNGIIEQQRRKAGPVAHKVNRQQERESGGTALPAAEYELRLQAITALRFRKRLTSPRML